MPAAFGKPDKEENLGPKLVTESTGGYGAIGGKRVSGFRKPIVGLLLLLPLMLIPELNVGRGQ